VDDPVPVESIETLQNGVGKLPHELQAEAVELVLLDQLVQVDAQQLKRHADVRPKDKVLQHMDNIHPAFAVLAPQLLQYTYLLRRLPVESLLIPYDLHGYVRPCLVVIRLHHMPKTALANHFQYFISVREVIMYDMEVRTLLVVISIIIVPAHAALPFLSIQPGVIYLIV